MERNIILKGKITIQIYKHLLTKYIIMKTIIVNAWTFIRRFWTIVEGRVNETREEHKFKNSLAPIIAIDLIIFGFLGFVFQGIGWRTLALYVIIFWCGQQTQALISVFKKLKKQNNW